MARTRTALLLLARADEDMIAQAVQRRFPDTKILDSRKWSKSSNPPIIESMEDCGRTALLWPSSIYPVVPTRVIAGVLHGPQVGPVVRWMRSRIDNSFQVSGDNAPVLQYGRLDASIVDSGPPEMVRFIDAVWRILNKNTTNRLLRVPVRAVPGKNFVPERRIRTGMAALDMARRGEIILNADRLRLVPEELEG